MLKQKNFLVTYMIKTGENSVNVSIHVIQAVNFRNAEEKFYLTHSIIEHTIIQISLFN